MTAPRTPSSRPRLQRAAPWAVGVTCLALGLAFGMAADDGPDWTEDMHPELVASLMHGDLDDEAEARTLRFLAATSDDARVRWWASQEAQLLAPAPVADAPEPAPEPVVAPAPEPEPEVEDPWSFDELSMSEVEAWEPLVSEVVEDTEAAWFLGEDDEPVFDDYALVMEAPEPDPSFTEPPPAPVVAMVEEPAPAPIVEDPEPMVEQPEPEPEPEPVVVEVEVEEPPPPPPPVATMSARELDLWVLDGSADDVRDRVASRLDGLKECYADALAEDPTLSGAVELEWNVFRGRVKELAAVSDSLGHAGATSCITDQVARWSFDAETHGVMTWLVSFQPEVVASK